MAKTLLDLDPDVLSRAMELSGQHSKKATVMLALEEMIQRRQIAVRTEEILAAGRRFADLAGGPLPDHGDLLYDHRGLPA